MSKRRKRTSKKTTGAATPPAEASMPKPGGPVPLRTDTDGDPIHTDGDDGPLRTSSQRRAPCGGAGRFVPLHKFPNGATRATGWQPSLPDYRDCTPNKIAKSAEVKVGQAKTAFQQFGDLVFRRKPRKSRDAAIDWPALDSRATKVGGIDLRERCSPIEDQGDLGSCTAHATVAMVEYLERVASGTHIDASRLFLYKVTRNLLNWTGDTGAYLRSTMKALVLFGVPPEELWPYDPQTFEIEPDAFMYAYAANYKAVQYMRLDPPSMSAGDVLTALRATLCAKHAVALGFPVYSSLTGAPDIPFPKETDRLIGGHAVLAVGFDDDRQAVMIRNSWGPDWGTGGYGWLPYRYFTERLASDIWTCFKLDWVESGQFGF